MKKIIHISDLHVGYEKEKNHEVIFSTYKNFEEIIEKIIDKCTPPSDFIILITGDLVDNAKEGNGKLLKTIKTDFLDVLEDAGFNNILIVPGNHDYGTGNSANVDCMRIFKETIYGDKDKSFPDVRVIDGIAFIGLDSMQGELKKNEGIWADGEVGKEQIIALDEFLSGKRPLTGPKVSDCKYTVIYLHHHPIDRGSYFKKKFHGLDDADDLKNVLAPYKIDALLFGHNHDGRPWYESWGIPRVYDAGSTTGKRNSPGPIRIIDLSKKISPDSDLKKDE
jgi:3',5'-cyclic AMP phosphodiesterase CpdA